MRKTTMKTGVWLLVAGLILATIGLLTNAPKTVVWNNGLKVSRSVSIDKTIGEFDRIKVSDGDGDVEIRSGSDYGVNIEGDEVQAPTYRLKDKTLYIDKKQGNNAGISGSESVVVTVPTDKELQQISLESSRDAVTISNVKVKKLLANGTSKANDYNSSKLTLDNVTVSKSAEMNLNYTLLNTTNSTLNELKLISRGSSSNEFEYDDDDDYDEDNDDDDFDDDRNVSVTFADTTVNKAQIQANSSNFDVKNSVLQEVTTSTNYGRVRVTDTTLKGINEFKINNGIFSGKTVKTDGVDLSNNKGLIKYFNNTTQDHVYQENADAENILRVNGNNLRISVK